MRVGGGGFATINAKFAGAVLSTDGINLIWVTPTNLTASATNAIGNLNGSGTNTAFYGPITFAGAVDITGIVTNRNNLGVAGHFMLSGSYYVSGVSTNANDTWFNGNVYQGATGGQGAYLDELRVNSISWFTNTITSLKGIANQWYHGAGPFTNSGKVWLEDELDVTGSSKLGGNLEVIGSSSLNGLTVTNVSTLLTNLHGRGSNFFHQVSLPRIASGSLLRTDANSNIVATTIGANLTFDGTTLAATGGAASTNNVVQAMHTAIISNTVINPWHAGVVASIYATNGDSQFFTLGSHTNLDYVPFTGADTSNHIGVAVAFTQNATGGFYPTNNGQVIPINTNASRSTMVYYSIANGVTNVSVAYPFSMGLANGFDIVQFDTLSGTYTNKSVISVTAITNIGHFRQEGTTRFLEATYFLEDIGANRLVVTNSFRQILATQYVPTNSALSNVTVSFTSTNNLDLYITNNITLTNWTGLTAGIVETKTIFIYPQLIPRGVNYGNLGFSNPGYSVAIGTNANNKLWTTLTNNKTYVLSIVAKGTNLFPTISLWE